MSPFRRSISQRVQLLMPGLSIKRWLGVVALGATFMVVGMALVLNLQPMASLMELLQEIALVIPSTISGPVLMVGGLILLYCGFSRTSQTVMVATGSRDSNLIEALYRRNKLSQGPRIVAIGGGTGLSTLLRGLKAYTSNITAIVTVGDDGGSSGRLRKDHGVIPPGDLRNCIAALADEEQLITELFQYRFSSGDGLDGHSFGNLFLTAMCQVTGDMLSAIRASSDVLNISGRVLPATLEMISLSAELADGTIVQGESNIPEAAKFQNQKIVRMSSAPANARSLPDAIEAIEQADIIILGPGSLYTSIIPNLLIDDITEALAKRHVPKIYVAAMMSQAGETDGMTVADHIEAILNHANGQPVVNAVLVNDSIPSGLLAKYRKAASEPVERHDARCTDLGVSVIEGHLINEHNTELTVRHHPLKVTEYILHWYRNSWLPHQPEATRKRLNRSTPSPVLRVVKK